MRRCGIILLCLLVSGSAWAKKPPKKQIRSIKFLGKNRLGKSNYPLLISVYTKYNKITKIHAYNGRVKVVKSHAAWSCPKTQTITFKERVNGLRVRGKYCAPKNKTVTIMPRERKQLKYLTSWMGHIKRIKPSKPIVHLSISTFTYKKLYLTIEAD